MDVDRGHRKTEAALGHRSLTGPIAIFGRGRMLSLVLMVFLTLFSYLAQQTSWNEPVSTAAAPSAPSSPNPLSNATPQQIVASHGGVIEDRRAAELRRVGDRLAAGVTHLPAQSLRFYLLRDQGNIASYAMPDGNIFVTGAQFDRIHSESDLAAFLSQRIADFVYRGYARTGESDRYAAQVLAVAGYQNYAEGVEGTTRVAAESSGGSAWR